ncbi:MAG: hypothetical protein KJP23_25260 [Deltaproteobacteria bacterium]|nr:hypothetical protein [Deltaproteobacteria bacterium]
MKRRPLSRLAASRSLFSPIDAATSPCVLVTAPVNASPPPCGKPTHDSGPWLVANHYHAEDFHPLFFAGFYRPFRRDPLVFVFTNNEEECISAMFLVLIPWVVTFSACLPSYFQTFH